MEITIKEVEATKLNLGPDEILVLTIKSDEATPEGLEHLQSFFKELLPRNRVLLLALSHKDEARFSIMKGSEEQNYCLDCNCGKKEAAEGQK